VANNPAATINAQSATDVLNTVTTFAVELEKLIAAAGVGGSFNAAQVEHLTLLFGNLAGVVIQAAHAAMGKDVTADSVLALMPSSTVLENPVP